MVGNSLSSHETMSDEERIDAEHRARAISKLRSELTKDISRAAVVAGACGLWELLRLCYLLRLTHMLMIVPAYREKLSYADLARLQLRDEVLKYAIGLVAKYGTWADNVTAINTIRAFNNERVDALEDFARHINAKFETEAMLHVARIRVEGDRDQDCYLDLEAGLRDPQRSIYFNYGLRLERFTIHEKERTLTAPNLVRRLYEDFFEVADLFEVRCGISLSDFCEGIIHLEAVLKDRLHSAVDAINGEGHELINPDDIRSFVGISRAFYFTDTELENSFSTEFVLYLRNHPFDPAEASEAELRFHYLTRRPFLMGQGFAVLSPDLFFDSVLNNVHFTLLEGDESKVPYMNASSSHFLDRVAALAANSGYEEVARDVFLYEGKQTIGDIDLVLHNSVTGHNLLVEGKNHALPLPVYFKSAEAIDAHLARNRDWEKKVKRRILHLHGVSPSYKVEGAWDYIVASLMPEPLSHQSDILILSLEEFEQWLRQKPRDISFAKFYSSVYKSEENTMSMDEMNHLQKEGYFLGKPAQGFPA